MIETTEDIAVKQFAGDVLQSIFTTKTEAGSLKRS
jgi:hypothetical protein